MNLLDKIKIALKVNSVVNQTIKEARMGTKGYKTTEFWMNLAAQAGVLWGAIQGFVPPKIAAIVSISGAALYTVARTIAKAVTEIQATKAATTTVATTEPVTTVTTPTEVR